MGVKQLAFVLGSILMVILMGLGLIRIMAKLGSKGEIIFIDYVRERPKRIYGYCSYPISKDYPWADFANIKRVVFSQIRKGIYQIRFETYDPIPTDIKDKLCFLAYFDTPSIYGVCDTGVIYANKNYPFSSTPPSPEGGVFRTYCDPSNSRFWVGDIKVLVKGSVVVIEFMSELVEKSKQLDLVIAVYLPDDIRLPKGYSMWATAEHDVLRIDPELEKGQIMIPYHP
ncbi:MAG: hypothetical protein NZ937_07700 [Armatimonadetes bacterium]|nr:hypothetical protein [Armatimonadota bacterium]